MLNISAFGFLSFDPQERQTNSGLSLVNFKVVVKKQNRNGEDVVTELDCTAWGDKGQAAMQNLKKGDFVGISGAGQLRSFDKKDGSSDMSLSVNVQEYSFPPKSSIPF